MSNKDIELFEQARRRVQRKIKGRCVRNEEVIIDQEKEIVYYRNKIRKLTKIIEKKAESENNFKKELELTIKEEEYLIRYNDNTDAILLTMYINKIINDPEIVKIFKDKEFKIWNKTRINKRKEVHKYYEDMERIKRLWQV